jgi:hypothetical protein
MIDVALGRHERYVDSLADGIRAWLQGDESPEAMAAGELLAETTLLHRALLLSLRKEG